MTVSYAPAHSFTHLLTRYISGGVAPDEFEALCDAMEDACATPSERLAFARFFLDSGGEVGVPQAREFVDIVGAARA